MTPASTAREHRRHFGHRVHGPWIRPVPVETGSEYRGKGRPSAILVTVAADENRPRFRDDDARSDCAFHSCRDLDHNFKLEALGQCKPPPRHVLLVPPSGESV